MTSRDFVFWLQGYLEIASVNAEVPVLNTAQVLLIRKHLGLVFTHEIDPSMAKPEPKTPA